MAQKDKTWEETFGIEKAKEMKLNMSKVHKGKVISEKQKKRCSEFHKGKIISKETKRKMSKARKLRWRTDKEFTEKVRANLRTVNIGRSYYLEELEIFRLKSLGENNPNWKGGLSFQPYSPEFNKTLKEQIRKRDIYTCQLCGYLQTQHIEKYSKSLIVHHIDFDKQNNNYWNLILLCLSCHLKSHHKNEGYYKEIFKNKLQIYYELYHYFFASYNYLQKSIEMIAKENETTTSNIENWMKILKVRTNVKTLSGEIMNIKF